ncbi:MAG: hypothetical protein K2X82_20245 [Gemmataceae bacterium]|nr:hypothetical protein [Gemmataceae bacterium]
MSRCGWGLAFVGAVALATAGLAVVGVAVLVPDRPGAIAEAQQKVDKLGQQAADLRQTAEGHQKAGEACLVKANELTKEMAELASTLAAVGKSEAEVTRAAKLLAAKRVVRDKVMKEAHQHLEAACEQSEQAAQLDARVSELRADLVATERAVKLSEAARHLREVKTDLDDLMRNIDGTSFLDDLHRLLKRVGRRILPADPT